MAYAHAEVAPQPVAQVVPAHVAEAVSVDVGPEPEPEIAPAAERQNVQYAAAVQTLVQPLPAVSSDVTPQVQPVQPTFVRPKPQRTATPAVAAARAVPGRFVVQLGAFSNSENAQRAWSQAERRFGLGGSQPFTTTIDQGGRTLHRVSVAGFASQADATRLCGSIKAKGGACFVRAAAGDALASWAPRSNSGRA